MSKATDIKKKYNVWIARYGEYKPDVKLVYWQLSSTGKVQGITGDVDINVFNGYQGQFAEFVRTGYHR
jgi:lysozyme